MTMDAYYEQQKACKGCAFFNQDNFVVHTNTCMVCRRNYISDPEHRDLFDDMYIERRVK